MIDHTPFFESLPLRCRFSNFIYNFLQIFFVKFFIRQKWLCIIIVV